MPYSAIPDFIENTQILLMMFFCKINRLYIWGRKGVGKNMKEFTRKLKVPDFHSLLQCLLKTFVLSNL